MSISELGLSIDENSSKNSLSIYVHIPFCSSKCAYCSFVSMVASEDDKGYFRVSFRSKGELSARAVAETFGGGGHLNASGCKIFGNFDEVKQQLLTNTFEVLGWKNDN